MEVGEHLKFTGPYGRFFVRKSSPLPMIFFAGGSGLSSPKSMILDLFEEGVEKDITLIHGAQDQAELYYRELFEELDKEHDNFTYIPVLSNEPENSNWLGMRGFVHEAAVEHFDGKFAGHKAYLCGPPPMVDACVTALMKGRLFEKDIYMENFFSQSDAEARSKSPLFKSV
jgi:phenol hydroxylase P5 protein